MNVICHVPSNSSYKGFYQLHPWLKVTVPFQLSQMEGQREQAADRPSVRGQGINASIVS